MSKDELRGRLAAFLEVHEHWEFEDDTEERFDAWMHERIKALKKGLDTYTPEVIC